MRLPFAAIGSIALALVLTGCGSTTPAGSSTPGATLAPGATATLAPVTTPAPTAPGATGGTGLTGHECDAIPTFSISNPIPPSFVPDTTLEAHFPATIDGQPVTDVTSQRLLEYICYSQGQAGLQAFGQTGGVFNLATMSWASATATVDGDSVDLTAVRTAGGDSSTLVQYLSVIAAVFGVQVNTSNAQQATVGGKAVFTTANSDGTKNYVYPSGDTLIFFKNVTDSQATKILTALP